MSSRKPVLVVIGGQYGSEAKGAVAAALCKERGADIAVRTGTVNAGHTVYRNWDGVDKAYKMQQLPTSWAESDATMMLGPGAYINPRILVREIEMIDANTVNTIPILIDSNAGLHLEKHTDRSTRSGRHHSMGATGKGCSEAVVDKIMLRGSGKTTLFRHWWNEHRSSLSSLIGRFEFVDTGKYLTDQYRDGKQILIEGTQGCHLDLQLGPYPYTTHKQTQAAQWIQEAGLPVGSGPAAVEYEVVMVVRTYPIRVAGNSGPMPRETSWVELGRGINNRLVELSLPLRDPKWTDLGFWEEAVAEVAKKYRLTGRQALDMHKWSAEDRIKNKIALSELHRDAFGMVNGEVQARLKNLFEFTTVTNKLRRIAEFDPETVRQSIRWNAPNTIVLSFFNYWFPETWNCSAGSIWPGGTDSEREEAIIKLENELGQDIEYVTTGPKTEHFLQRKVTAYAQAR